MLPGLKPLWLICEDGTEYIERFSRLLAGDFRFARAADAAELVALLARGGATGVILDLDFRRTPPERLIDEAGKTPAALATDARRLVAEAQGIYILRLLRARGFLVPVLLYADLDDPDQAAFLERTLGPLVLVPGHEGLVQTAARMRALGQGA